MVSNQSVNIKKRKRKTACNQSMTVLPILSVSFVQLEHILIVSDSILVLLSLHVGLGSPASDQATFTI